jgi:hypothetical protein
VPSLSVGYWKLSAGTRLHLKRIELLLSTPCFAAFSLFHICLSWSCLRPGLTSGLVAYKFKERIQYHQWKKGSLYPQVQGSPEAVQLIAPLFAAVKSLSDCSWAYVLSPWMWEEQMMDAFESARNCFRDIRLWFCEPKSCAGLRVISPDFFSCIIIICDSYSACYASHTINLIDLTLLGLYLYQYFNKIWLFVLEFQ